MARSKRTQRLDYGVGALVILCIVIGLAISWLALRYADGLIPHILPDFWGGNLVLDGTIAGTSTVTQTVSAVLSLVLGIPVALLGSLVAIYRKRSLRTTCVLA